MSHSETALEADRCKQFVPVAAYRNGEVRCNVAATVTSLQRSIWRGKYSHHDLLAFQNEALQQLLCDLVLLTRQLEIAAIVSGRVKSFNSICRKMRLQELPYGRVFDLVGARAIVANVLDCYRLLSWVRRRYCSVPGLERDYIANPKCNGYQSLHTTILTASGIAIEVQLRTIQMHQAATSGSASIWEHKAVSDRAWLLGTRNFSLGVHAAQG